MSLQEVQGRAFIMSINSSRESKNDFAFGEYTALNDYFDIMNRVQTGMVTNQRVLLDSGIEFDTSTPGGLMGLQVYIEAVNAKKEASVGLSKAGVKNENKWWTLQ